MIENRSENQKTPNNLKILNEPALRDEKDESKSSKNEKK